MSRELDVRVARALGCNPEWVAGEPCCDCDSQWGIAPHGDGVERTLPHYSTDIAAAWLLVDWAEAHGFVISIEKSESLPWRVYFFKTDHKRYRSESGRTPAEAICHAFLVAVEAENG